MAFDFNGTSEHFHINSAVISGPPFTVSVVFRADDASGQEALWSLSNSSLSNNQHALYIGDQNVTGITGDQIGAITRAGGWSGNAASSTTGITAGKIHNAVGVWRTTSNRSAYLDGGSRGDNTSTVTPSGMDVTDIGQLGDSSPNWWFGGMEAEVAVWNVDLIDEEIAWLGKLFSPLTLTHRLGNLILYKDLIRDPNRGLGPTLIMSGSPSVVAHPPIIYPSAPIIGIPVAAAPPTGAIMNQMQGSNMGADLYNGTLQ